MNKIIYIILCSLLLATYGKGQNAEEFNQIYNKIYLEISQKDFERATAMADSLYNISETPIYRAKSLMLSASLFEQSGDLKKAINYAKRADKELEKSDNYIWKTRILGFLATQHRYLSLYKESENYVNQAIEQAKKIPDSQRAIITEGFLLQEKAFSESDKENYREALKFFEQTQEFLERANADQFLTLQNMQFTAQCHFELGEYDKAESNLDYILKNWGEMPDNYVKGLTY